MKGFTLIEILVTLAIVALVLATAVPAFMRFGQAGDGGLAREVMLLSSRLQAVRAIAIKRNGLAGLFYILAPDQTRYFVAVQTDESIDVEGQRFYLWDIAEGIDSQMSILNASVTFTGGERRRPVFMSSALETDLGPLLERGVLGHVFTGGGSLDSKTPLKAKIVIMNEWARYTIEILGTTGRVRVSERQQVGNRGRAT